MSTIKDTEEITVYPIRRPGDLKANLNHFFSEGVIEEKDENKILDISCKDVIKIAKKNI